jgi:hypothetical protein
MTDLVSLLYRADWTRLSLAAEVSTSRDLDLDRTRYGSGMPPGEFGEFGEFGEPGEGMPPPWQMFREARKSPWARHEWKMATDQLGAETRRYTLLIEPGRRYREQGENHVSGCDGDRSWFAVRDADGWKAGADDGWTVEGDDGPEPLMPQMMCPSWLLTGYTLEAGEMAAEGQAA